MKSWTLACCWKRKLKDNVKRKRNNGRGSNSSKVKRESQKPLTLFAVYETGTNFHYILCSTNRLLKLKLIYLPVEDLRSKILDAHPAVQCSFSCSFVGKLGQITDQPSPAFRAGAPFWILNLSICNFYSDNHKCGYTDVC